MTSKKWSRTDWGPPSKTAYRLHELIEDPPLKRLTDLVITYCIDIDINITNHIDYQALILFPQMPYLDLNIIKVMMLNQSLPSIY